MPDRKEEGDGQITLFQSPVNHDAHIKAKRKEAERSEPGWLSGKGVRLVSGRTPRKVVVCGHCLVTLSIISYRNIRMALIAAHLNAEVILVVTVQR